MADKPNIPGCDEVVDVIRHRAIIDNEKYYFLISKDEVIVKIPYENRPQNERIRRVVDGLCEEFSRILREVTG